MSSFSDKTRLAHQLGLLENRSQHVDTRPLSSLFLDYYPIFVGAFIFCIGVLIFMLPPLSNLLFLVGIGFVLHGLSAQMDYLISAPYVGRKNALNDRIYKGKKPRHGHESEHKRSGLRLKAGDALMLVGYDLLFNRQLWIDLDRETRMALIVGTTGAGKTVTLCCQLFQACIQGHLKGGAPIVLGDGKGSIKGLYEFVFYIIRTGRIHDLRVLNFLIGGKTRDINAMLDEDYPSNKFNPFSILNHDESRELIIGSTASGEGGGSNQYFLDRASSMIAGQLPILVYARDNLGEPLDIRVISQSLGLRELIKMASRQDVPDETRTPLKDYLKSLNQISDAYFNEGGSDLEINQKAEEQHTYNKSMLTKALNDMSGALGHIFSSVGSDINPRNTVLHGQILIMLLPAIERDPTQTAELGRMFINSMRPAFSSLFGYQVQGSKKETIDSLASTRLVPTRVWFDEINNYYASGISQLVSLLRAVGVNITLLAQSIKAFENFGLSEARQTESNLNNKYVFASQDTHETKDLLNASMGTTRMARAAEKVQTMWGNWRGAERVQYSDEELITMRDLSSADPMEGIYLYRGNVIPMRSASFFPNTERDGEVTEFYLNHFADLDKPNDSQIQYIKSVIGFERESVSQDVEAIDSAKNSSRVLSAFAKKLEGVCENIQRSNSPELYSSLDALIYTYIDELVEMDLQQVSNTEAQLLAEADKQRTEALSRRSAAELMDIEGSATMVVDSAEMYATHSAMYAEKLGLNDDDIVLPNFSDDELADEMPQLQQDTPVSANEPVETQSTTPKASINRQSLSALLANAPNFGHAAEAAEPATTNDVSADTTTETSLPVDGEGYDYGHDDDHPNESLDFGELQALIDENNRLASEEAAKSAKAQSNTQNTTENTAEDESTDVAGTSTDGDAESDSTNDESVSDKYYQNESVDRLIETASQYSELDKEFIKGELLNVKIYPTQPTPPVLGSQSEQDDLTGNVKREFDDASQKYRQTLSERQENLIDRFLLD
ncbi:TraM recognition domain-containing protein [Vibrio sp. Hal054]|uniref:TraM recognition domain-containing protein n=1 Tax=Vibrio sp. Hal054 TaxID=3035158 RepID=UPI00301D3854